MDKELEQIWKEQISADEFARLLVAVSELKSEQATGISSGIFPILPRLIPALCLSAVLLLIYSGNIKNTLPTHQITENSGPVTEDELISGLQLLLDDSALFNDMHNNDFDLME